MRIARDGRRADGRQDSGGSGSRMRRRGWLRTRTDPELSFGHPSWSHAHDLHIFHRNGVLAHPTVVMSPLIYQRLILYQPRT